MDWQALGTVVALIGVGVTFVFSVLEQRRSARKSKEDAAAAQAGADRSERAASLTIDAMGRIATALEGIAELDFGNAASEPAPRVEWSLRWFNGDTYILTNEGRAVAQSVRLSADESLMTPAELPDAQTLQPGEAVTFMAARTMGTVDSTITVTWAGDDGQDLTWRYPLPPRPKR